MKRSDVDRDLEERMLTRADLIRADVRENGEPMVALQPSADLSILPIDPAMLTVTGSSIYVRRSVAARLSAVSRELARRDPGTRLEVVYGYRSLEIQTDHFDAQSRRLSDTFQGNVLIEATHRRVAAPDVAGHPTGGAVDVHILDGEHPRDMGTAVWDFTTTAAYVFSPYVGRRAWENRQTLRGVMLDSGFAPFDGEWWHFSFGDREWARYWDEPVAPYTQLRVADVITAGGASATTAATK